MRMFRRSLMQRRGRLSHRHQRHLNHRPDPEPNRQQLIAVCPIGVSAENQYNELMMAKSSHLLVLLRISAAKASKNLLPSPTEKRSGKEARLHREPEPRLQPNADQHPEPDRRLPQGAGQVRESNR